MGVVLAVSRVVGKNILDVFLAVSRVVGENILGVFLTVPRVVGKNILDICLATLRLFRTPIPCAAHVPPRCRVRRKSVCEIHAGHRAAINALYPKIESKTAPRADQNVVRRYPKPFKIQPGGTQAHPDATKRCPRAAKRCSKDTQERPRNAQEQPRGGQERPEKRQKRTEGFPESSKIDSGTFPYASWARFSQEPLFERLWDLISIDFRALRSSANLDFYCSCQCFLKVEAFTQTNRKCRKKPQK